MEKIANRYTQENSEKQLTEVYQSLINQRMELFQSALGQTDEKNKA